MLELQLSYACGAIQALTGQQLSACEPAQAAAVEPNECMPKFGTGILLLGRLVMHRAGFLCCAVRLKAGKRKCWDANVRERWPTVAGDDECMHHVQICMLLPGQTSLWDAFTQIISRQQQTEAVQCTSCTHLGPCKPPTGLSEFSRYFCPELQQQSCQNKCSHSSQHSCK